MTRDGRERGVVDRDQLADRREGAADAREQGLDERERRLHEREVSILRRQTVSTATEARQAHREAVDERLDASERAIARSRARLGS